MMHSSALHSKDRCNFDGMPPINPLVMPQQDFNERFIDPNAKKPIETPRIAITRALIMLPAILITGVMTKLFADGLSVDGISTVDVVWVILIAMTVFWMSFLTCLFAAGLISSRSDNHAQQDSSAIQQPLNVAVLMPIYNENVADVFANISAMQQDLHDRFHPHTYFFYILSDSQDKRIIAEEQRAFTHLVLNNHSEHQLYYRRREKNSGYKIGNLRQWIRHWGGAHDAALVLDADSLMGADAILSLTNRLAQNADIGLVQGPLRVLRSQHLLARLKQFSCETLGSTPARGLALWSGSEGNYFGHNAIFRIKAFAACAGLPALPSRRNKATTILSHDFVEAALLRRAGWGVDMMPECHGSFEQVPESLIDHIHRDRRWCYGNMQHLRIMFSAGFHPVSRFHMFYNALGYLMSPIWCLQILILLTYGLPKESSGAALDFNHNLAIFVSIFGLLLFPKIISGLLVLMSRSSRRSFGGGANFVTSFCMELTVSILVTPTIMIHQTFSIIQSALNRSMKWNTPSRQGEKYSMSELLNFHQVEFSLGIILLAGVISADFSMWMLPLAISLALAPVISHLSCYDLQLGPVSKPVLMTPLDGKRPRILDLADIHRNKIRLQLTSPVSHPHLMRSSFGGLKAKASDYQSAG